MLSPKRFFRGSALALVALLIFALLVVQYSDDNNDQDQGRSYPKDEQEDESGTNKSSSDERSLPSDGGSSSPLSSNQSIEANDLLPELLQGEKLIHHFAYDLVYNEMHEQAQWVAYTLKPESLVKRCSRTDNFRRDPFVRTGTADVADYRGSGYDRGHLVPAGDMVWSTTAMSESFFFSNICPQNPSFNRGIWKKLEELMRTWAADADSLCIVTGPLLSEGLPTLGGNKVSIPKDFFKVILRFRQGQMEAIGFVLPNRRNSQSLRSLGLSVDRVESLTGIDFFAGFPDATEAPGESNLCSACWTWSVNRNVYQYEESSGQGNGGRSSTSVQCSGTTKKGRRCRNRTRNASGYCYHHVGQR